MKKSMEKTRLNIKIVEKVLCGGQCEGSARTEPTVCRRRTRPRRRAGWEEAEDGEEEKKKSFIIKTLGVVLVHPRWYRPFNVSFLKFSASSYTSNNKIKVLWFSALSLLHLIWFNFSYSFLFINIFSFVFPAAQLIRCSNSELTFLHNFWFGPSWERKNVTKTFLSYFLAFVWIPVGFGMNRVNRMFGKVN